jgi:hypothetical protein
VKDSSGQKLACVYYEEGSGQRSVAKLLTRSYRGAIRNGNDAIELVK